MAYSKHIRSPRPPPENNHFVFVHLLWSLQALLIHNLLPESFDGSCSWSTVVAKINK